MLVFLLDSDKWMFNVAFFYTETAKINILKLYFIFVTCNLKKMHFLVTNKFGTRILFRLR